MTPLRQQHKPKQLRKPKKINKHNVPNIRFENPFKVPMDLSCAFALFDDCNYSLKKKSYLTVKPQQPDITFKTNGASYSYQLSTTRASVKENL